MRARALVATFLAAGCASAARAPTPAHAPTQPDTVAQLAVRIPEDSARIAALLDEGLHRSRALADVRYLSDVIGPRLTGSDGMRRAADWMAGRLRAYGADTVWLEPVPLDRGWERGPVSVRLLLPHERWIQAASAGWAPGTDGPIAGDVVLVDARTLRDFQARFAGRLAGAWVMTRLPLPMFDVFAPGPADSARVIAGRAALHAPPTGREELAYRDARDSLLAVERIAGTITSSDKDRGLLTMFGSPVTVRAVPALIVSHETFASFHRLLAAGERVRLEADVRNRFTGPIVSHNVIAEWRGTSRADEVVLLGAHLDSWDLATGATDNGAGAVAVVEALRLLTATGGRPARTVRVALFTGEEQGLLGAEAHLAIHRARLDRIQSMLVVDNGSGRITGITLQGRDDLRGMWEELLRPLAPLGPFTVEHRVRTGSDHLPFLRAGVPAHLMNQAWRSYDWTWHTQVDTYDHIVPDELRQMATVLASLAWRLARAEPLVPRAAP